MSKFPVLNLSEKELFAGGANDGFKRLFSRWRGIVSVPPGSVDLIRVQVKKKATCITHREPTLMQNACWAQLRLIVPKVNRIENVPGVLCLTHNH